VARVPTVLALVSESVEQEFVAESTQYELVELLLNEFVSVHFVDFFLALSHSTLTTKTADSFHRSFSYVFLG
jgi:hypothetical protein